MPKYFRSMVLKYQFLERGGDMGKIAPKYFSEHICRVFGITPPGKTHTIFEKFLHLLRFLEKLLMAASVPKNRCSEYSKYFPWQIWAKVFKSGPSKICGRHPLKNLKEYGLLQQILLIRKAATHKFFYNLLLLSCWKCLECIVMSLAGFLKNLTGKYHSTFVLSILNVVIVA